MDGSTPATERSPGRYRLLILGGGFAGTGAVRAAARRGVRAAVVLPEVDENVPAEHGPFAAQVRQLQARLGTPGPLEVPCEPGIDVYRGAARFCRRHAVVVGGSELHFHKAVIATGSATAAPAVEGAETCGYLRPEELVELGGPPRRLAVIGVGAEACGFAQAFRRFGSEVHLIGRRSAILPQCEPAAAAVVEARLVRENVRLYLGCEELLLQRTGSLRSVVLTRAGRKEKLLVDEVLIAAPRRCRTSGLGLEAAAIRYGRRGIAVDPRLRTSNRAVFAAGAVCGGGYASPQAAEATGRLAVDNALGLLPRRVNRLVIPRCVYTDPQVAEVGLSAEQARQRGFEVQTHRVELAEAAAGVPEAGREGFVALHVDRRRLLGATVVAAGADELIAPLVLLLTRRLPPSALASMIPCRPSRVQLLRQLARQCHRPRL